MTIRVKFRRGNAILLYATHARRSYRSAWSSPARGGTLHRLLLGSHVRRGRPSLVKYDMCDSQHTRHLPATRPTPIVNVIILICSPGKVTYRMMTTGHHRRRRTHPQRVTAPVDAFLRTHTERHDCNSSNQSPSHERQSQSTESPSIADTPCSGRVQTSER